MDFIRGPVRGRPAQQSRRVFRHRQLQELLEDEPLLNDQELAQRLGVSVPTVRLDRQALGVPEVRERARRLAEAASSRLRAMAGDEVVGELVELELGRRAVSLLHTRAEMGFARSKVVRGHYLFAQANSLAVALVDAEQALTGAARVRFLRPVRVGETVAASARVRKVRRGKHLVEVQMAVEGEPVFRGQFIVAVVSGASDGPSRKGAERPAAVRGSGDGAAAPDGGQARTSDAATSPAEGLPAPDGKGGMDR